MTSCDYPVSRPRHSTQVGGSICSIVGIGMLLGCAHSIGPGVSNIAAEQGGEKVERVTMRPVDLEILITRSWNGQFSFEYRLVALDETNVRVELRTSEGTRFPPIERRIGGGAWTIRSMLFSGFAQARAQAVSKHAPAHAEQASIQVRMIVGSMEETLGLSGDVDDVSAFIGSSIDLRFAFDWIGHEQAKKYRLWQEYYPERDMVQRTPNDGTTQ